MSTKQAAIVPSKGIGDGLMMLVAAHALLEQGHAVTVISNRLHELSDWFPSFRFVQSIDSWEVFDRIVAQFDYTPERREFFSRDDVDIFYPVYNPNRCPPLKKSDRVFAQSKTMVENIAEAIGSHSIETGCTPPEGLKHRGQPHRVVIHPTSTDPIRTYAARRFQKVAQRVKKAGYEPVFAVAPHEREVWDGPLFPSLAELAAYLYESGYFIGNESGTSHLASCLGIPTVVIAGDARRIAMWQPGWAMGTVLSPPNWVPNMKGCRLRTNRWQWFISPADVMDAFYLVLNKAM